MKPNWNKRKPKKVQIDKLYDLSPPFDVVPVYPPLFPGPIKLLGEQLFDRCEELGIILPTAAIVALQQGAVLVCFSEDKDYAFLSPITWTKALAGEIERRQKARGQT